MKWFTILAIIVLLGTVVYGASVDQDMTFEQFKKRFNKHYTAEEEPFRRALFEKTARWVRENNGTNGVILGINQFADLTPEELSHLNGLDPHLG